jgi:hypothetical protein
MLSFRLLEILGIAGDVLLVGEILGDDGVEHRRQHARRRCRLERSMCVGVARQRLPRGSITISFAPRLAAFLMKVAATG